MRDRLTLLPDSILVQILSHLTLRDAVRTTVLSKPWVNLWTQLSSLVFRFHTYEWTGNADKFTSFLDGALSCHSRYASQYDLESFCVSLDYYREHHKNLVDSWLRYVINRNAKQIDLIFHELNDPYIKGWSSLLYDVRRSFFLQNHVLTTLNLKYCRLYIRPFDNDQNIRCNSLRSLSLNRCHLRSDSLSRLLEGCPVLERLELVNCKIGADLHIYHECLKELVTYFSFYYSEKIRISTPNLRILALSGRSYSGVEVIRLTSSVEVFIDLDTHAFCDKIDWLIDISNYATLQCERVIWILPRLYFEAISTSQNDSFGHSSLYVLSSIKGALSYRVDAAHRPMMPSPELSCASLVLLTTLKRSEVSGLAWLLRRCPLLETLTVDMTTTKLFPSNQSSSNVNNAKNAGVSIWSSLGIDENLTCLEQLKYVDVIGLIPNHDQAKHALTEFLRLLLEHGKVLEKLSIKTPRQNDMSTLDENMCGNIHFELARLLLSFPRFSQHTKIQFIEL